jgi:hypothetical protein
MSSSFTAVRRLRPSAIISRQFVKTCAAEEGRIFLTNSGSRRNSRSGGMMVRVSHGEMAAGTLTGDAGPGDADDSLAELRRHHAGDHLY